MPRSRGASKTGDAQQGTERVASPVNNNSDSDDDILETSENGRYQKMNEQVTRDVPGIDAAYLAMDTEDGVEVVWNEVRYSNRKAVSASKESLTKILKKLTEMKHPNIVDFMDFWHDKVDQQDRLVFITEHMTSGSLLLFLKRTQTKRGPTQSIKAISDKMWRRWCRQILSALSYLHKNDIIHGNLSLASIFIQHNGAIKIGSVSPDAIHEHVKTKVEHKRLHYTAPEYAGNAPINTMADIYSFGVCALEMLSLNLLGTRDTTRSVVKKEDIDKALHGLQRSDRRQFIELCLSEDPKGRPKASHLLKKPVLQEVFELKVLSAAALKRRGFHREEIESEIDRMGYSHRNKEDILAETTVRTWRVEQVPPMDWEKFLEEVQLDVVEEPRPSASHTAQKKEDSSLIATPRSSGSASERNSGQYDPETRMIHTLDGDVRETGKKRELWLQLKFDDKMQRDLKTELKEDDSGHSLAMDLVFSGLVSEADRVKVSKFIDQRLQVMVS